MYAKINNMKIKGLINKITDVLTNPETFFENIKKETGVKSAFVYLVILSLFSTILGFIIGQLFEGYSYDLISKLFGTAIPQPQYTTLILISLTFLAYGWGLLSSFITAGILHVWILIFRGKETYSKTYQLFVYSSTPGFIIGWIPFISYLAWIYSMILLIIGTQKMHGISKTKSILMYVIPTVLMILFFLVIFIFLTAVIKANPTILQNMSSLN
jgi:hypothetical protein